MTRGQALQTTEAEVGWRLPNIKELLSIVEQQCLEPALNLQVFPNSFSSDVWSSSPFAVNGRDVWFVYSTSGHADHHDLSGYSQVRLVRSGQ